MSLLLIVFVWWKINSSRFSILSKMVRDVLTTPISIVAFESAFNIGSMVLNVFIISLYPPMVETLIYAQNWLRSTIAQFDGINVNEEFELFEKIFIGKSLVYFSSKIILYLCCFVY